MRLLGKGGMDPKQVGGQHGVSDAPRNREVRNDSLESHTKLWKNKLGQHKM